MKQRGRPKAGESEQLPLIVKIHADWCSRCQAIEPTWQRIEKELGDEARIVVLDVTDETRLQAAQATAKELGLESFFVANRSRTGTVAIFKPGSATPAKLLYGEKNFEMYETALKAISAA